MALVSRLHETGRPTEVGISAEVVVDWTACPSPELLHPCELAQAIDLIVLGSVHQTGEQCEGTDTHLRLYILRIKIVSLCNARDQYRSCDIQQALATDKGSRVDARTLLAHRIGGVNATTINKAQSLPLSNHIVAMLHE